MVQEREARLFAHRWVDAWNSHNLEAILSHYAPQVVLITRLQHSCSAIPPGGSLAKKRYVSISRVGSPHTRVLNSNSWKCCEEFRVLCFTT